MINQNKLTLFFINYTRLLRVTWLKAEDKDMICWALHFIKWLLEVNLRVSEPVSYPDSVNSICVVLAVGYTK